MAACVYRPGLHDRRYSYSRLYPLALHSLHQSYRKVVSCQLDKGANLRVSILMRRNDNEEEQTSFSSGDVKLHTTARQKGNVFTSET